MNTHPSLAELLAPYRSISIIGMAKNTGKTSTLNYLIQAFHRTNVSLALTSIGRDGESVDVVTQTDKPRIFVFSGTLIATTELLLPLCDITKKVVHVSNFNTPLGRVVLVEALSDGFVQLGGPSITAQVLELLEHVPLKNCIDKVIVDGAIDRKSFASPDVTEATVLCTGAALSPSMNTVLEETRHTVRLLTLQRFEDAALLRELKSMSDEKVSVVRNYRYIRGSVTDSLVSELVLSNNDSGIVLIAEDASKVFIKPAMYEKLTLRKAELFVQTPIHVAGVTVNPFSPYHAGFDPADFLQKMQDIIPVPVYDIGAQ